MNYALLILRVPTNVEKTVREIKTSLFRTCGLVSAQALPVLLPLCFVSPDTLPESQSRLTEAIRRAVGKQALHLHSAAIGEHSGILYWELDPGEEIAELAARCREALSTEPEGLFPVVPGFLLGSLQGHRLSELPIPSVPDRLSFPTKAAAVLRIRILEAQPKGKESGSGIDPWWSALYWEVLGQVPLRKTAKPT